MHLKTVEELRELRASKTPLFHVEYLPYLDFFEGKDVKRKGYGYGREDDIYTSRQEADRRFAELKACGQIETLELWETVYDSQGGRGRRLLDEWADAPARGEEVAS